MKRDAPAPGRRERRKRATRQALLDAALELFGERGLYVTRVEDVTERADVAKGAFYNYFDSKTALVAALVAESAELLDERLRAAPPAAGLPARLDAVALAHERFFRAAPGRALVFHQARGLLEVDDEATPQLQAAFTDYLGKLARYLFPDEPKLTPAQLDAASATAGAIAGYRSFKRAAGLTTRGAEVARLLVAGVPGLTAHRE